MRSKELLTRLLNLFEENFGLFAIKDFIGFVDWNPSIGAALLPHTGHHSEFCSVIKRCPRAYDRCVRCANVSQHICQRRMRPFAKPCFLGISEYTQPIIIKDHCVGSISVGFYTDDRADALARIQTLCRTMALDEPAILQHFYNTVRPTPPDGEAKAVLKFFASFIADLFLPYYDTSFQEKARRPEDSSFHNIYNYILQNYTDPNIRIDSIARACNYSPSHVSHTFNQHMKVSLRSYINQLRIILAKHELRNGRSVSYTAMVCGFNDTNYFSRIFREHVGVPPSQYSRCASRDDIHSLPSPDLPSLPQ